MMQVMKDETLTPEQFAFWLQGFCEIHGDAPTPEQWVIIKEHLALCFRKVSLLDRGPVMGGSIVPASGLGYC